MIKLPSQGVTKIHSISIIMQVSGFDRNSTNAPMHMSMTTSTLPPTRDGATVKKNRNKLNLTLNLNESNHGNSTTTAYRREVPSYPRAMTSRMNHGNLGLLYGSQNVNNGRITYENSEYYDV